MTPLLPDLSFMNDEDSVGLLDRGKTVSDDQSRAPFEKLLESILDQHLGLRIDGARRLVENQNLGIEGERSRERKELSLSLGQRRATLLDLFLITVRKPLDEGRDVHSSRRLDHPPFGDAGISKRDIGRDVPGEEKNILQHEPQVAAQLLLVPFTDIDPIDQNRSALDLIETAKS